VLSEAGGKELIFDRYCQEKLSWLVSPNNNRSNSASLIVGKVQCDSMDSHAFLLFSGMTNRWAWQKAGPCERGALHASRTQLEQPQCGPHLTYRPD